MPKNAEEAHEEFIKGTQHCIKAVVERCRDEQMQELVNRRARTIICNEVAKVLNTLLKEQQEGELTGFDMRIDTMSSIGYPENDIQRVVLHVHPYRPIEQIPVDIVITNPDE